jgi:DNA-binding CsgD family transcriptional regulator
MEGGVSLFQILDIAEGLLQLDPVRTYPQRGAELVARLARASSFRMELGGEEFVSEPPPPAGSEGVALPLRHGRDVLGTLHLYMADPNARIGADELRLARWGARVLARGMSYAGRLASEGGRRGAEPVEQTLKRAPLTPRERDVVSLLVGGSSTRDIATRTGLTVSTVNTYLKRIFAKVGVHSRVELVARMAGTDVGDGAGATAAAGESGSVDMRTG